MISVGEEESLEHMVGHAIDNIYLTRDWKPDTLQYKNREPSAL